MNAVGNSPIDALLTLKQVSSFLGVSTRQVYRLIAEGKIPVLKVGKRSPRVRPSDIEKYLESCTVQHGI